MITAPGFPAPPAPLVVDEAALFPAAPPPPPPPPYPDDGVEPAVAVTVPLFW